MNPFRCFHTHIPAHTHRHTICVCVFPDPHLDAAPHFYLYKNSFSLLCVCFVLFWVWLFIFYCTIRLAKHFTFAAHMNFKFLKMFQSFPSSLYLYLSLSVSRSTGVRAGEWWQAGKMLIVRKSQCALGLPRLPLIEMIFNGLKGSTASQGPCNIFAFSYIFYAFIPARQALLKVDGRLINEYEF